MLEIMALCSSNKSGITDKGTLLQVLIVLRQKEIYLHRSLWRVGEMVHN